MLSVALLALAAQAVPDTTATPSYLVAWVAVAFISGTPGVVAAVLSTRNRNETRAELAAVRHEVMPNSGSSSFDILHRLAWETHERTEPIGALVVKVEQLDDRVAAVDDRVDALELHPCPLQPSEV